MFCSSPGERSAALGRTVRDHYADGPRHTADGPLNTNRTTQPTPPHADGPYLVLRRSASNSCRVNCPRRPCGLSAKQLSTKSHWQPDQNEGAQEHAKKAKNTWAKPSTRTVRTHHADGPRGANRRGNSSPKTYSRAPYHLSFQGSPERLKLLRKDLGKM
jgi:hypothetical protein